MTIKETKLSKDDYIPPSLRIPNLDFDSCLKHVDYNIEKLSKMSTNEGNVHPFDVLNHIVPIITNVCRLVDKPATHHDQMIEYTFPDKPRSRGQQYQLTDKGQTELSKLKSGDAV